MYTGISLLGFSLTASLFTRSAAVCSSVVGNSGSYTSGFSSRSGRESIQNSCSTSVPVCLIACTKVLYFPLRYWVMPVFLVNMWQIQKISTMCGTPNIRVEIKIANVKCFGEELIVTSDNISTKNRMKISTVFILFDLCGLAIA